MFNRFEIGNLQFAQRPRFSIEEREYTPTLFSTTTDGCTTCNGNGAVQSWEIIFNLRFIGNGDLTAARRNYKVVEGYLNDLCNNNLKKFVRQYCAEDPLEHYINRGYIKPIDMDWTPDCCDTTTLAGEVHLFSIDVDAGSELMVYSYEILKPNG